MEQLDELQGGIDGYVFDLYYDNIETMLDCGIESITVPGIYPQKVEDPGLVQAVGNDFVSEAAKKKVKLDEKRDEKKRTDASHRQRCMFYIRTYSSNIKLTPHEKTALNLMMEMISEHSPGSIAALLTPFSKTKRQCEMSWFLRAIDFIYSLDESNEDLQHAVVFLAQAVALLLFNTQRVQSYGVHSKNEVHSSLLKNWAQALLFSVVSTKIPEDHVKSVFKDVFLGMPANAF